MSTQAAKTDIFYTYTFDQSIDRLPLELQGQTYAAIRRFQRGQRESLHFEPLAGSIEPAMSSIRINQEFRLILCYSPEVKAYAILYVGEDASACQWAKKRRLRVNPQTGNLQIYREVEETEAVSAPREGGFFPSGIYSDETLLKIGVPREHLDLVRTISSIDHFAGFADILPQDILDRLVRLAITKDIDAILRDVADNLAASGGDPRNNPETLRCFDFRSADDETFRALSEGSLERWRVYLHPRQRKLVQKRFSGPALVLGGAGTGKTVAALHRAKALAGRMVAENLEGKILFTCYNANLPDDIREKLRTICTKEELAHIDVQNIDRVLTSLKSCPEYQRFSILYPSSWRLDPGEKKLRSLWEDAVSRGDPQRTRLPSAYQLEGDPIDLYRKEWSNVVTEQDAFTQEAYCAIQRVGSKASIKAPQRAEIWKVFQAYMDLCQEQQLMDAPLAMYRYRQYLEEHGPLYRHVIVDEAQDFSAAALRLVRALAGPEHQDDIFLVADPRQRIYPRLASLSQCGIRIMNRVSRLELNYRTTRQLQEAAMDLLSGESFDDLNGAADDGVLYYSLTHGAVPQVHTFENAEDEAAWILDEIEELTDRGVSPQDICLTAYTNKQVKRYFEYLQDDLPLYHLKRSDDRSVDGVRICTMHRTKGLEFQYVFIAGVSEQDFPSQAIDPVLLKQNKCLLYVALTRAQRGAYVSGYGTPQSRFLTALSH